VGDGVDQNCDGVDGVDADADGTPSSASGGTDCNDADATVFPGASETWLLEPLGLDFSPLCGKPWQSGCSDLPAPNDLVVDAQGALHVAFVAPGKDGGAAYASNTGGTWWFEVVATENASDPQVAVGPGGERYLAFSAKALAVSLRLATSPSPTGAWSIQTLGSLITSQLHPRIAVDGSGVVHLVGTDRNVPAGGGAASANDLFYANSSDGYQEAEILLPGTEDIVGLSLAVTSGGVPHVAWHDDGTTTLSAPADPRTRYVQIDPANSIPGVGGTLDDEGSHGATFIALDATGEPVISHWRSGASSSNVELRVTRRAGVTWTSGLVLTAPASRPAPIAFGAGLVHLCSVDTGSLDYFVQSGGSFAKEAIVADVQSSCQIVFDAVSAKPRLVFERSDRMWHATPSPSPGVDRNCDGADG
jgi:hypothetical protein